MEEQNICDYCQNELVNGKCPVCRKMWRMLGTVFGAWFMLVLANENLFLLVVGLLLVFLWAVLV